MRNLVLTKFAPGEAVKYRRTDVGPKLPSVGWHSGGSHAPGRDFSGHTWRGQNARTRALGQGNCKNRKRRKSGRGKIGESLVPRPRAGGRRRRTPATAQRFQRATGEAQGGAAPPRLNSTPNNPHLALRVRLSLRGRGYR